MAIKATGQEDWDVDSILKFAEITKIAKALEGYEEIWFDESITEYSNTQNQPLPEPD